MREANFVNHTDWIKHKFVVFQSDDWGSCYCSANFDTFSALYARSENKKLIRNGKCTLESSNDMDRLFNILLKYHGGDGKPVIFQPAYIMSNPDYNAIKNDGYKAYFDMVIPNVPSKWQRDNIVDKVREGINKQIWLPVYHGNSHFNKYKWMELVKAKDKQTMASFEHQTFISERTFNDYEYDPNLTDRQQEISISTGIKRFYNVFGYYPKSAIAPAYVWQNNTEKLLAKYGIKVIQGKNLQEINRTFGAKVAGKFANWAGKKAFDKPWQVSMCDYNPKLDLYYLNRNVYFEPFGDKDSPHGAFSAYRNIVKAWENGEPAVVCTHRINYVYLDDDWVEENLRQLDILLDMIKTNHPDALYLTDWDVIQIYQKN